MIESKKLKSLTLCFSGSFNKNNFLKRFAMNLIKKITKSKWSHVSFVYPDKEIVMCQEATSPTVQRIPLYNWLKKNEHEWEIYEIDLVPKQSYIWMLDELWNEIGQMKYGFFQLFTAAFSYLFRTKNLISKGVVCSEYVMTGLEKTSLSGYLSKFYDKDTISLQDIYQMVKLLEIVGLAKLIEKEGRSDG